MIYCVLNNNTFKLFSREHINKPGALSPGTIAQ